MNAITKPRAIEGPRAPKPPTNPEAEQAFLGALLVDNRVADQVAFLKPEHFWEPVHGRIFDAAMKLIDRDMVKKAFDERTKRKYADAIIANLEDEGLHHENNGHTTEE